MKKFSVMESSFSFRSKANHPLIRAYITWFRSDPRLDIKEERGKSRWAQLLFSFPLLADEKARRHSNRKQQDVLIRYRSSGCVPLQQDMASLQQSNNRAGPSCLKPERLMDASDFKLFQRLL
ncbi:hypothetical protein FQA47_013031 [Oryzias melastigma]|uniref:Uncharacterized protein n=1 Tax=Oryzias melastigma TaxID=30732 RepID=A0A834FPH8_ORYME|nr:hypothetical protein FQA47_013031 [Oryzias melastigma]